MPTHRHQPHHKYDPADFIIPAQDAKGHSERVYASIQPGDSRALDVIKDSRRFPFRTKGDIIRWSIREGIRKLEHMEDVPSVSAQVDMIAALMREEQFHSEFEHTFEQMGQVINRHMANAAYGEVRRVIAQVRMMIDRMPEGYWKDRYLGRLDDQFQKQMEAVEALSGPPSAPRSTKGYRVKGEPPGAQPASVTPIRLVGGGGDEGDEDDNDQYDN